MMIFDTFRQLTDSLRDTASYVADLDTYEILFMSDALRDLFHIPESDLCRGKTCYQILHQTDHPCTFCVNQKLEQQIRYSWMQYHQGISKWLLIDDRIAEVRGRRYHVAMMRDADECHPEDVELEERLQIDNVLLQCIQILSTNSDHDAATNSFLETLGRYYDANRAYIFENNLQKETTDNTFEWCADGVEPQRDVLQNLPLSSIDDWMNPLRTAGEIYYDMREEEPGSESYRLLEMQGIQCTMAVPLSSEGEIVGFIGVDDPRRNRRDLRLLRASADFLAVRLETRRMIRRLEYLSDYDILTGCYNRNKYVLDLNVRYRDVPQKLGLIVCSINGMKATNNTYGQKYGDQIVTTVADLLRRALPFDVYRIGGDEFFIPCPDVELERFSGLEQDVRALFHEHPECSVSFGVSWAGENVDIDEQILRADDQLRAEKQDYYRGAVLSGRTIDDSVTEDLFADIENGAFVLFYQPQVDLDTGRIIGAEALVRKRAPDGALLPPGQFIPYYEAQDVMMHLDFHVLELMLRDQQRLLASGYHLPISVNFTRTTLLVPDFVERILSLCRQYQVPVSCLKLEVTETVAAIDRNHLQQLLEKLFQAGIYLSLDDFGSEYSNIAILAEIPFREVKLDKSMVDSVFQSERSRAVLSHMVRMCVGLAGTEVVAEGIESAEQAALLREYGSRIGQGYYYYRPMPFAGLEETLLNDRAQ